MAKINHFGLNFTSPESELRLTRENYIQFRKDGSVIYDFNSFPRKYKEDVEDQIPKRLLNFDLNMDYFKALDRDEFNSALDAYLEGRPNLIEVFDLNPYEGVPGIYVLVLDEYKQVYIGSTNNIKLRIRQHWRRKMPFDRLIFGGVTESRLSIDSFRALDTTRIFATRINNDYMNQEIKFTRIDDKFRLNRTLAGPLPGGLPEAIAEGVPRQLIDLPL